MDAFVIFGVILTRRVASVSDVIEIVCNMKAYLIYNVTLKKTLSPYMDVQNAHIHAGLDGRRWCLLLNIFLIP